MIASNYLDLLSEDLLTNIFKIITIVIEKDIEIIENTLDIVDNSLGGNVINGYHISGLEIVKKRNPRKIKIILDNNEYAVPHDVYSITYGYIKYDIPDPHLNSNTHLFSRYPLDNIIIILRADADIEGNYNNETHETHEFPFLILQSPVLKSPLYLDILRETNKLYIELSSIRNYYTEDTILSDITQIGKDYIRAYNITPNQFASYNYITNNVLNNPYL
jgi:hypothetical protein